jgi:hypothetical protein
VLSQSTRYAILLSIQGTSSLASRPPADRSADQQLAVGDAKTVRAPKAKWKRGVEKSGDSMEKRGIILSIKNSDWGMR